MVLAIGPYTARMVQGLLRAPRAGDAALVAALAATGVLNVLAVDGGAATAPGAAPLGAPALAVLAVVLPLPLWWRRRRPLVVLGATLALLAVTGSLAPAGSLDLLLAGHLVAAVWAAGAWSPHRRRMVAAVAALGLLWFLGGLSEGRDPLAAGALAAGMVGLPAVAGGAGRTRRLYLEAVEERLAVAERERDERARQAIAAERARLARELHDVVAHHVSLIGVQAGAARVSLDRHPDGARRALAGIEESSRQAVTELHQLLDVLRPLHPPTDGRPDGMAKPDGTAKPDSTAKPDGTAKPSGIPIGTAPDAEGPTPIPPPAPGLERLPALVEQWCRAGMAVRGGGDLAAVCAAVGPTGPISPALSTTCYRIVEEALTNAARHGAAGTVWVTVALEPTGLRLEVRNPLGAGPPTAAGVGAGRGLVGMAERAAPFDGRVTTGPREGGFVVEACFPLDALAAGSRR